VSRIERDINVGYKFGKIIPIVYNKVISKRKVKSEMFA